MYGLAERDRSLRCCWHQGFTGEAGNPYWRYYEISSHLNYSVYLSWNPHKGLNCYEDFSQCWVVIFTPFLKNKDFKNNLFDSFPLHYWLQYTLLWVRTSRNAYCIVQKQWSARPQYAKLHCRVCISNLGRNMAMHLARAAIPEEHNIILSKKSSVSNGLQHLFPHKSVMLFRNRFIREFQNERRSRH